MSIQQLTVINEKKASNQIKHSVILRIAPEALASSIELLLSQRIAFEVQYDIKESIPQKLPAQTPLKSMAPTPEKPISKQDIIKAVYDKYVQGVEFPLPKIEQIAAEYGISAQTLKVNFQKTYGKTLYKNYMEVRMKKSAALLRQGYNANKVSQMVGYGNRSAIKFNKMFQQYFGITPKKYQQQILNTKVD